MPNQNCLPALGAFWDGISLNVKFFMDEHGMDWYDKALEHFGARENCQALLCIEYFEELEPESEPAKLLKANILIGLYRFTDAQQILDDFPVELPRPERLDLAIRKHYYQVRGDLLDAQGFYIEAADYYQKIIDLEPGHTLGYIMKGACLAKAGEFETAKELHDLATELEGDPDEAYLNLGLIYRAEGKLYAAKKAFVEALKISPEYFEAQDGLNDVNQALELEKEIYELRLKNNPNNDEQDL